MNSKVRRYIAAGAAIVIVGGLVFSGLRRQVTLVVDGESISVNTSALTVAALLEEQRIGYSSADLLEPGPGALVSSGDLIVLNHATRYILAADGVSQTLLTFERIPANLFSLAGFDYFVGDQVYHLGIPVDPDAPLDYAPALSLELRRAVEVTLQEGGETTTFLSAAPTVADALWEQGVELYAADEVEPLLNSPLESDLTVTLTRARPLSVRVGGQVVQSRAAAETVGEALAQIGLALQGQDYSNPAADQPLPDDGRISLVRVEEQIVIEQQPLPFETRFEPDPNATLDTISTISAGEFGLIAQRVRVRYENGQEASRMVEDEFVAREPVDAVQGYGTQITVRTLDTPNGLVEYWRAVEVYATSYSPSRAGTPPTAPNYGITYSGAPLANGHIAVLRSWYPSMAGRLFYVPGYGVGTVADIGGGIPGRHWIDLGYTDEDWQQWAGTVTLYFLTPVPPPDQILWVLP